MLQALPALLIGAAVAGGIAAAYHAGHAAGRNAQAAGQQREEQLVLQAGAAAASAAAAAINRIEVRHVTVRQQLEREVVERAVYRDCRSGPDAVRLFNSTNPDAAGAAASAPPGHGSVPAPPAAE
jgi:hypothetical protein